ncbi:hypothetical protein BD410DRAFT_831953 [Rickenella mellea]|uniref:G-protein coupled receptors family 3 profile domain-containing protein n=1 Tax=Rickenella mellea TaxID=50990 RepID=A0A4Y7PQ65_9AGAM|nr:hypothetical protein BD410DRAFT_831953 [Rickenella mellea]
MIFTVLFSAINLMGNPSETVCQVLNFNVRSWIIVAQIGLYGILTLRTYAIYLRNRSILVILGLTGMAIVAVVVGLEVVSKPKVGNSIFGRICGEDPSSQRPRVQLASNILSLVFDVLVFTLTFTKTIRHAIAMRKAGLGNGLGYFVLRDGAMYFLAKLFFGVVGTTVFFVPASGNIGNWIGVFTAISNSLTVILINRLVLSLRRVSHKHFGNVPTHGAIGTIEEPAFATNSLLGNIGAPLRMGSEEDESEEISVDDEAEAIEECRTVDHSEIIEEFRHHPNV